MSLNSSDSAALRETRRLVRSLRSDVCPSCAGKKKGMQTFCGKCYFKLPHAMRKALYDRVGEGYEEAFAAACDKLGVGNPVIQDELFDGGKS
ncbi:MAG: hypothetical protein KF841_14330 [Phycisphaerae bacterium]|nr:hypothetical protein [Phycisphaerae bacterium]